MLDNSNGGTSCCTAMVDESETLKQLKPILIGGVIIYGVLLFVDIAFFDGAFYFYYFILGISLLLMTINRCYFAFWYYTIFLIIYVFPSLLSQIGIFIQCFFSNDDLMEFFFYIFAFFFVIIMFYFAFNAYKEMKYLYLLKRNNSPQLSNGLFPENSEQNNNYNANHNNNDNNNNKKKGFKAFSGKGYRVGGS